MNLRAWVHSDSGWPAIFVRLLAGLVFSRKGSRNSCSRSNGARDGSRASATTKIPLLWHATAVSSKVGFWAMQAESRTDFAMLMALLFLVFAGAGPLSLDGRMAGRDGPPT